MKAKRITPLAGKSILEQVKAALLAQSASLKQNIRKNPANSGQAPLLNPPPSVALSPFGNFPTTNKQGEDLALNFRGIGSVIPAIQIKRFFELMTPARKQKHAVEKMVAKRHLSMLVIVHRRQVFWGETQALQPNLESFISWRANLWFNPHCDPQWEYCLVLEHTSRHEESGGNLVDIITGDPVYSDEEPMPDLPEPEMKYHRVKLDKDCRHIIVESDTPFRPDGELPVTFIALPETPRNIFTLRSRIKIVLQKYPKPRKVSYTDFLKKLPE